MNEPTGEDHSTALPVRPSLAALLIVVVALGTLAILAWGLRPGASGPARAPIDVSKSAPAHDVAGDSPFLNVRPEVRYVGDETCARCHASIAKTFAKHPMGRSLSRASAPASQASPGTVFTAQGLEYAVRYTDGRIVHAETRRDAKGQVVAERAETIDYVVGSRRGGESYFFERDGFLFQSPISWYTEDQSWHLAPGYEQGNRHFERPAAEECLYCHANRVHLVPGTVNRYKPPTFQGMAIGCERCHGPGELHAAGQKVVDGKDVTIVNPRHLDPVRRESVCQQCHLKGEMRVLHAGRDDSDFRPGLPLHRFWSVFVRPDKLLENIQVVGHVEQMEASRCYQASGGRLGCTSCHDPHKRPADSDRVAYFRDRCLDCHAETPCSEPEEKRRAQSPSDSCIECHMPRLSPADVAHAATTLHRIPRRRDDRPALPEKLRGVSAERDILVHFQRDLVNARERAEVVRDRAVALANLGWELGETPFSASLAGHALATLDRALAARPDDVVAREAKGLALIRLERNEEALGVFERVLERDPARENATAAAAALAANLDQRKEAVAQFLRTLAIDPWSSERWGALASVYASDGDWTQAADAASHALRLNPLDIAAGKRLAEALVRLGKQDAARAELERLTGIDPSLQPALGQWFERLEQSLPVAR